MQKILRQLRAECPWLTSADEVLMRRYAESTVIVSSLFYELRSHGLYAERENGERVPRDVIECWRRVAAEQRALSAALGLNPVARKALGTTLGGGDDLLMLLARDVRESSEG